MQSVDRVGIFERLKHSVQLLASPAEVQLRTMPDFVCKADELALDFDLWKDATLSNFRSELTGAQTVSIDAISRSLSDMTRAGPQLWTEKAVRESEEWKDIRALAADALASFGWHPEIPPSHADEFVGGA